MTNNEMSLAVSTLNADAAQRFAAMTFPSYRHLLSLQPSVRHPNENQPRTIQPFAIGATVEGRPAGLLIGELPVADNDPPEILSLFVDASHRRQGVATALVRAAEQEASRFGAGEIAAVYMTGKPSIEYVERIFATCGWTPPETRMVSVRFTTESLTAAPWMNRFELGPEYEIFSWCDLLPEEREELIASQEKLGWIAHDLQPWDYEQSGYDRETSVGVRYKGRVVGWVINHRLTDETIRYTCSFIHKSLGRLGRILPLYSESFRRTLAAGYQQGMFVTPLYHKGMAKFALKWFAPWSYFVGETKGSKKILGTGHGLAG
jgi:GNAT superfamily N-acetyltransferase